jgi:hypothetical protein
VAVAENAAEITILAVHGGSDQRRPDAQAAVSLPHGATQAAPPSCRSTSSPPASDLLATRAPAARWHQTTRENT